MGQRLLIVDSDRTFLKENQVSLESAFEIEQISSPEGVAAKVEGGGYAAVLISVEISDNKGYALCSGLRKNPALADLKIVLISSKATEEEYRRHQSLKGRADLYLHKPISPAALVEALSPFVPPRRVDPDNPLGDLADGDFGADDWLSELRTDIESEVEPVSPSTATQPVPQQPANQTIALSAGDLRAVIATSESAVHEARVKELQAQLTQKDARVTQLEQDLQSLQRQHDSVTQNLDDLARRQNDAEELKSKLTEAEQALKRFEEGAESGDALRVQLREGMKERHELLQQVDSTNTLLAEKTQKVIDLMKERDRYQQKAMDDQTELERLAALEVTLTGLQTKAAAAEEALEHARIEAEKVPGLEEALSRSRTTEAETSEALGRLEAILKETTERLGATTAEKSALEARVQELSEAVAQANSRFESKADEVAGLETTVRSQGRDMVELNQEIAAKGQALENLQSQFDQQVAALQSKEEALSTTHADLAAAQARVNELGATLSTELARLESERADLVGRMNGELAAKDTELEARNRAISDLQDILSRHEASLEAASEAKAKLESHLAQAQDRMQGMVALFAELEGTLRKAAELAP